jgi:hypothetical protein
MIQIFGKIEPPEAIKKWIGAAGESPPGYEPAAAGLILFLNALIKLLIVGGGVYALLNIILAGYGFLGAGDDPKKMGAAWAKIWQSLLGLLFIAGSFLLAAIFGYLIFGDTLAILRPTITGPEKINYD